MAQAISFSRINRYWAQTRQAGWSLAMANLTGNIFAAARTNINPTRHAINQSILKNNLTKQGKARMQIKYYEYIV
jgi:hypothetical protein